jgi:ELL-associated factor
MTGAKPSGKGIVDYPSDPPNFSMASPGPKSDEGEEHQDIDIDDLFGSRTPEDEIAAEEAGVDISVPHQNDSDEEIADVDDSGDEVERGPNAAEALRAQVNAEERDERSSSSSSSSGSSSASRSSSSSSDSEAASDEDSVNSI